MKNIETIEHGSKVISTDGRYSWWKDVVIAVGAIPLDFMLIIDGPPEIIADLSSMDIVDELPNFITGCPDKPGIYRCTIELDHHEPEEEDDDGYPTNGYKILNPELLTLPLSKPLRN